jgi:hypothetical protein
MKKLTVKELVAILSGLPNQEAFIALTIGDNDAQISGVSTDCGAIRLNTMRGDGADLEVSGYVTIIAGDEMVTMEPCDCEHCGEVSRHCPDCVGAGGHVEKDCPTCNGTGNIPKSLNGN